MDSGKSRNRKHRDSKHVVEYKSNSSSEESEDDDDDDDEMEVDGRGSVHLSHLDDTIESAHDGEHEVEHGVRVYVDAAAATKYIFIFVY